MLFTIHQFLADLQTETAILVISPRL